MNNVFYRVIETALAILAIVVADYIKEKRRSNQTHGKRRFK